MLQKLFILFLLSAPLFSQANRYEPYTFGVAINPFGALHSLIINGISLSTSLSYFDYENGIEVALPFTYTQSTISRDWQYDGGETYDYKEIVANADIHIRKYFHEDIKGFYVGAFGRYTYLEGKLKDDYRFAKVHKFGFGAEIGFRVMRIHGSRFYWGMSLSGGVYLGDDHFMFTRNYPEMFLNDRKFFYDIEALRIGYEF